MSRYIDADRIDWRLIKPINPNVADEHMIYQARKLVESQPKVDLIEVVRCKDCMWNYMHVTPKGHDYYICRLMNLAFDKNDDFFCAYGKKHFECGEPIPHWRGQMDGCLLFQEEEHDEI